MTQASDYDWSLPAPGTDYTKEDWYIRATQPEAATQQASPAVGSDPYDFTGYDWDKHEKEAKSHQRWSNNQWWDPLGVVPNPKLTPQERAAEVEAGLAELQDHITRIVPGVRSWHPAPVPAAHSDSVHPDFSPAWNELPFAAQYSVNFSPPFQPEDPEDWDVGDRLLYGTGDLARTVFNFGRGSYENVRDSLWNVGQHVHSWFGSEKVDPIDKFEHIRLVSKQEQLGWDIPRDTAITEGAGDLALGLGAVVATLLIGAKALKSVQLASKGTALGRAGAALITPFKAAGVKITKLGQAAIGKGQSLPRQAVLAVRACLGRTSTQSNGGYLPITKERLAVTLGITAAGGILLGTFVRGAMDTQATSRRPAIVEGITLAQEGRLDELPRASEQVKACRGAENISRKSIWQEGTDVFLDAELSNNLETSERSETDLAVMLNSVLKCANGDRSIGRIINDATGKVLYQYGKVTP